MDQPRHPELDAKVEALAREFVFFNLQLDKDLLVGGALEDHLATISRGIAEVQLELCRLEREGEAGPLSGGRVVGMRKPPLD